MTVRVLFMGMLKELAGREQQTLQAPEGWRLGDLYDELQRQIPQLSGFEKSIALALNYEYADRSAELHENDEIALIPPVSGGTPVGQSEKSELPQATEHASLVSAPIDGASVANSIKDGEDGAVATFDGIVRNNSRGRRTQFLDYTAYEPMALRQMEHLTLQALAQFPIREARIVHRLGRLEIGETSVFVAVAAAHRGAAFDACRWLIDTLKKTVPIWKKEYFEDGCVWADGEPFPPEIKLNGKIESK